MSRYVGSGSRLQEIGKDVLMIFRTSFPSMTPKFATDVFHVIDQWAVANQLCPGKNYCSSGE